MRLMMALAAAAVVIAGAPATAQQSEPARVLFAVDSDTVSPSERARLDRFAAEARAADGHVVIAGHADSAEGDDMYTVGLSQRRANAVRDYLVVQGVPPGSMTTQAFGRSRLATTARAQAAQNRRVDVTVGPGSGW